MLGEVLANPCHYKFSSFTGRGFLPASLDGPVVFPDLSGGIATGRADLLLDMESNLKREKLRLDLKCLNQRKKERKKFKQLFHGLLSNSSHKLGEVLANP